MAIDFRVRHQFTDSDLVCSIVEWDIPSADGLTTAAELVEVRVASLSGLRLSTTPRSCARLLPAAPDPGTRPIGALDMRIEGVTALVAGANRGLGRAFARELAARGAHTVYAGARDRATFLDGRDADSSLVDDLRVI